MRYLCLIVSCLFADLAVAQGAPGRVSRDSAQIFVVGEVHNQGAVDTGEHRGRSRSILEVLRAVKPLPQADLSGLELLRTSGTFTTIDLGRQQDHGAGVAPGEILVVPRMPNRPLALRGAAVQPRAFASLTAILDTRPGRGTELAIRLHLVRQHPDLEVRRRHVRKIGRLGGAATRAVSQLLDMLAQAQGPLLEDLVTAIGSIGRNSPRARAAVAELLEHPRAEVRRRARVADRALGLATLCVFDCFPAGTTVQTIAGGRRIEDLRPGDEVGDGTGASTTIVVAQRGRARRLVQLELGRTRIRATVGHRFLTLTRGYVRADGLLVGDTLTGAGGLGVRIDRIRTVDLPRPIPVYTLELPANADPSFRIGAEQLVVASKVSGRAAPTRRD